jgi:hypothetical protein
MIIFDATQTGEAATIVPAELAMLGVTPVT